MGYQERQLLGTSSGVKPPWNHMDRWVEINALGKPFCCWTQSTVIYFCIQISIAVSIDSEHMGSQIHQQGRTLSYFVPLSSGYLSEVSDLWWSVFPNRVHAGITGTEMKYPDQAALVGLHSLYIAMHDDHISPQLGEKTVSTRMLKSIFIHLAPKLGSPAD